MGDIYIYAIGNVRLDTRDDVELELFRTEWRRRVKDGDLVLLPGEFFEIEVSRALERIEDLPGLKVITQGNSFAQATAKIPLPEKIVAMDSHSWQRITCTEKGPGLILINVLSSDNEEEWLANIKKQYADCQPESKDVYLFLSDESPLVANAPSVEDFIEDKNFKTMIVATDQTRSRNYWQGQYSRTKQNRYTAPDYRMVDADFLTLSPTMVGEVTAHSWLRKDAERSLKRAFGWERTENTQQPTGTIVFARGRSQEEWLYRNDFPGREDIIQSEPDNPDAVLLEALTGIAPDRTLFQAKQERPEIKDVAGLDQFEEYTLVARARLILRLRLTKDPVPDLVTRALNLPPRTTVADFRRGLGAFHFSLKSDVSGYGDSQLLISIAENMMRNRTSDQPKKRSLIASFVLGWSEPAEKNTLQNAMQAVLDLPEGEAFEAELARTVESHKPSTKKKFGFH